MTKQYAEDYKEATEESFRRWALKLSNAAIDSKGQKHQMSVVPAPTCANLYNDPQFLPRDEDGMETRRPRPRKTNVQFRAAAAKSREDYRKQRELQVVTHRKIKVGEKLFVD